MLPSLIHIQPDKIRLSFTYTFWTIQQSICQLHYTGPWFCLILIVSHSCWVTYTPKLTHRLSLSACWTVLKSSAVAMQMSYGKYGDYSCYRMWHVNLENNLQTHKIFSNNRFYCRQCENTQKKCNRFDLLTYREIDVITSFQCYLLH